MACEDIIEPFKPSEKGKLEIHIDLNKIIEEIENYLIDRVKKKIDNKKKYKKEEIKKIIEIFKEIHKGLSGDYDALIKTNIANVKKLNKELGKLLCLESTETNSMCIKVNGDIYLIKEDEIPSSNSETNIAEYIGKVKNKINKKDIKQKFQDILSILGVLFNENSFKRYEKYIKTLNKIKGDNVNYLSIIACLYLNVVRNYALFDDLEWILVLLSRYASNLSFSSDSKGYLPVCPTLQHVVIIYYILASNITSSGNSSGESSGSNIKSDSEKHAKENKVDVCDFMKYLLSLTASSTTS